MRRRLLLLSVSSLALAVIAYFGPQTLTWRQASKIEGPLGMSATPRVLTDTSFSAAPGTALAHFGITFEVPWTGVQSEVREQRRVELHFKSGQRVSVSNPDFDLARADYDATYATLAMTPSRLSPFQSRKDFAQHYLKLARKAQWLEHAGLVDIFEIENESIRGFEISSIRSGQNRAELVMFDGHGRRVILHLFTDGSTSLTQADVNRVIRTLRTSR